MTGLTVRPVIMVGRDLDAMVDDAVEALVKHNGTEPRVFRQLDKLVRVSLIEGKDEVTRPQIKGYTTGSFKLELALAARWLRTRGEHQVPTPPDHDVIMGLLGAADLYRAIPPLDQIVGCPVFARDGRLRTAPGYSPDTWTWFESADGAVIPHVPDTPTTQDVERAKQLLLTELLGDFPFEDDSDRAHAVGLPLTAVTRRMFDGPVPLHGISAPEVGTGKTLLADTLLLLLNGQPVEHDALPTNNEEMNKSLIASLLAGKQFILWDNVNGKLDSPPLANFITTTRYGGRILGGNDRAALDVNLIPLFTGNNFTLGHDFPRRTVQCRLNAHLERPSQGRTFRHDPLIPWVRTNRGDLLWAAYVLVRNWLARGRPPFTGEVLGTYEEWSRVVGGVLEAAGIKGFLDNRQAVYDAEDDDVDDGDHAFLDAWWASYGDTPCGVASLIWLAIRHLGFDPIALGTTVIPKTHEVKLGRYITPLRGRVIDGYEIRLESKRPKTWRLQRREGQN